MNAHAGYFTGGLLKIEAFAKAMSKQDSLKRLTNSGVAPRATDSRFNSDGRR